MIIEYLLVGFTAIAPITANSVRIPAHYLGSWTGTVGDEHDTTMCTVKFDIRNLPDTSTLTPGGRS